MLHTSAFLNQISEENIKKDEANNNQISEGRRQSIFLKGLISKIKIQQNVQIFKNKMLASLEGKKSKKLVLISEDEVNQNRIIKCKGIYINQQIQSLLLIADIAMSLLLFVVIGFQGFLVDFRDSEAAVSYQIYTIKIVALTVFVLKMLVDMVQINISGDKIEEYITDIIITKTLSLQLVYEIISISLVIAVIIFPKDSSPAIIQFIFSFTKIVRLFKNLKIIEGYYINTIRKQQIWNLIKIIIFNIFFAHFVASLLLIMVELDNSPNQDKNWQFAYGIQNEDWNVKYYYSYYWAITIMTTIGFGDIIIANQKQALVLAFIQVFSTLILALNISEIGAIFLSIKASGDAMSRKVGIVRRMSRDDNVSIQLQQKISNHLIHQFQIAEEKEDLLRIQLLSQLPENLRKQYEIEAHTCIFKKFPFFNTLQQFTLINLIEHFQSKIYYSGQTIFNCHRGNLNLTIIKKGKVGLRFFKPESRMNGALIQSHTASKANNQNFLINIELLFLIDKINYDITAESYCFGLEISADDLLSALRVSKVDTEFYYMLRDKSIFQENPYQSIACEYCQGKIHTKFKCKKLHYIPYKSSIIQKGISDHSVQARRSHCRRKIKKYQHVYIFEQSRAPSIENQRKFSKKMLNLMKQIDWQVNFMFQGTINQNQINKQLEITSLEIDEAVDYNHYFSNFNPREIFQKSLKFSLRKRIFERFFNINKQGENGELHKSELKQRMKEQ